MDQAAKPKAELEPHGRPSCNYVPTPWKRTCQDEKETTHHDNR
jgi:hypothetical protein